MCFALFTVFYHCQHISVLSNNMYQYLHFCRFRTYLTKTAEPISIHMTAASTVYVWRKLISTVDKIFWTMVTQLATNLLIIPLILIQRYGIQFVHWLVNSCLSWFILSLVIGSGLVSELLQMCDASCVEYSAKERSWKSPTWHDWCTWHLFYRK